MSAVAVDILRTYFKKYHLNSVGVELKCELFIIMMRQLCSLCYIGSNEV